jgi:chemotaxis methyl-accepting protein methylase
MSEGWWDRLAAHFQVKNGFPLPVVMRAQAEREVKRLCPGPLERGIDTIIASTALTQTLVDSLGMGLTWFNRENRGILGLVAFFSQQMRTSDRSTFWLWSAGCSMGHEPYSIAMALLEAGARPVILATDLNREHLRIADKGRYRAEKLDMIPAPLLEKYFKPARGGLLEVVPELRRCVTFQLHNFATSKGPPPGWSNFDAVVCRNALIYYDSASGTRIASSLVAALREGGVILVGAVERPILRTLNLTEISEAGLAKKLPPDLAKTRAPERTPAPARAKPAPRQEAPRPAPARTKSTEPEKSAKTKPRARKRTHTPTVGGGPEETLRMADEMSRDRSKTGECIELLSEALVRFPLSAATHLMLGLTLKRADRKGEAITPLRAARFLDSTGWLASYHLALCLEAENQAEEAQMAYRDTLALIEGGHPASSTEIPGVGDLKALASTVAEHCTRRLTYIKTESA